MRHRNLALLAALAASACSGEVITGSAPQAHTAVAPATASWRISALPSVLPTCTGTGGAAVDINKFGTAAGYIVCSQTGRVQPVFWSNATGHQVIELTRPTANGAVATAVNSRGIVVGYEDYGLNGIFWVKPTLPVLMGNLGGSGGIYVEDVNDLDTVVGLGSMPNGQMRAFSWTQAGGFVVLPTLGGTYSDANAITSKGIIYGAANDQGGTMHAVAWNRNGSLVDLGAVGGGFRGAANDNNYGVGVGANYGFFWSQQTGSFTSVPAPGAGVTYALDVNNAAQVVGYTYGLAMHAFVFDVAMGSSVDLGVLPGTSSSFAQAISDCGNVVGESGGVAVVWESSTC